MVERCHRRLKDALRARLAGPDWPLHLPWVLMGLRAAPREDTGVSAAEIVFGAPLVLPGQILDMEEPPPADFIAKLRQSGQPPPSRPLSYAQMAAKPAAALLSAAFVYIRKAARSPPCRRSTAARTRSSPRAQRCSGCRWASGKSRSPLTALSGTGGPLQSSQRSRRQGAGLQLADFSSHPLPQGLVLARGPVGAQIDECINVKNPPNCVGGIRVFIRVSFLASLLLALLRNTSIQFYTAVYYFLVFYRTYNSGDEALRDN
jgi:hypothetical protein